MNATRDGPRASSSRASAVRIRSRGSMAPFLGRAARVLREDRHVLVAATREADEYPLAAVRRGPTLRARERVRALERRQNAFASAALLERGERLVVARGHVFDAADRLQQRVL